MVTSNSTFNSSAKTKGTGGLGLKYVRARLEEAFGQNWKLESHAVDGGWKVTITMPKHAAHFNPERKHADSNRRG
jgi:signal transduction histidine kinase